ncbi:MAG: DegT/DnrJ/EryC1/StrS family aminotransferase [Phycisphaerales bacterium]|nr:DegT/DnrJ/EryC1/StrS family aminotransferase [Phycisphaerales bacterium]
MTSTQTKRLVKPFFLDISPAERTEIQSAVGEILESGQLILGPKTDAFENAFAKYVGTKFAVSVSTGTAALEIILRSKNVEGKAVAVPTNTNFATVAAILHAGARPVYVDMDPSTFMPNLKMLEQVHKHENIAGAIWVHIGGLIAPDFIETIDYCKANGLFMIEDAAHAHGSALPEGKAGSLGDAGAFSFFPTKVMTTLEGGMITTDDEAIANMARSLRNQGKGGAAFGNEHTDLGNSWRLNEIEAAIGLVQLRKLDDMVARRERGVSDLTEFLPSLGLEWCSVDHMSQFSGYKLIVKHPEDDSRSVSEIKEALKAQGVIPGGGVYDKPCHLQPVFSDVAHPKEGLPISEKWCPRHICPPITSGTTEEDSKQIRDAYRSVYADRASS